MGMIFKKQLTLLFSILVIVVFNTSINAQIESMRPKNLGDDSSFNIPSIPNSPNETFEFINPQNEAEKFEQTLNRIMQQQVAAQELKDLQNKGIVDKQKFYEQRLQAEMDGITNKLPIIDQDLGGFSTQSEYITIICRDFGYPDGDIVSILVNNELTVRHIELTQSYQQFTIRLVEGMNIIDIVALNQGQYGPNTAAFMIFDESGNVLSSNQWNLATGAKASLSIARDEYSLHQ
jgi:hypothetical protein